MSLHNKQPKEKKLTCKRKIAGSKQVVIGTQHSWVKSFDPRYSVCQICGAAKKN